MKSLSPSDEAKLINDWWINEALLDQCESDVTTESLIKVAPALLDREVNFGLLAKKDGVFSGQKFLDWIESHQSEWKFDLKSADGARIKSAETFVRGRAPLRVLLARERMILNMIQHLSGIATATAELVEMVRRHWKFSEKPPAVLHTRKFLPGLRDWQAQAVLDGGGESHRLSLSDRILFKDNHKKFLALEKVSLESYYESLKASGDIDQALIEVETVTEGIQAAALGVRNVLLDNFTPEMMSEFFRKLPPSSLLNIELSGNLSAERLPGLLVDRRIRRLSFGSITHSVRALDISLEIME